MGVYRKHFCSSWSSQNEKLRVLRTINLMIQLNNFTLNKYHNNFYGGILELLINYDIELDDLKFHKNFLSMECHVLILNFLKIKHKI